MEKINYSSKSQRILGFFIDRIILFTIWFFLLKTTSFADSVATYLDALAQIKVITALKLTIYLPIMAYAYLLVIYFIYFVLFHLWTNRTIGKWLMGTELIVMKDNIPTKANFKDLLRRYFYLYISGVGGLGYLYIFHKNRKSNYDDTLKMYVTTKK